ncbi:flavodoxin, short chain [Butyrivibrio hungatei DSM 14810]|uniref:Flavodoxin n=1 Tax=Butyrivibrio hungatei DSM 14810 TaxID=1121132 RepID=A0A1M7RQS0_9FIRM|nr:flavodoxin [Butyrivibrio hungatei]SHN48579.1 flavodoxin, short chain [Butyrivibrio hungatei DSM 14810]
MNKVKVVFWSGSGNTQAMADAVANGITSAGGEAEVTTFDALSPSEASKDSVIAFGCPAMGAEVLEEGTVEPFMEQYENICNGKKIALFGSYGWGDGQWMRDWVDRLKSAGATIIGGKGVIANNAPDDAAISECEDLGRMLAQA